MTFITGKHISRRALLRGAGAAIGLPLLNAMRPAQAHRIAVVYVPNGIVMNAWMPEGTGKDLHSHAF